MHTSLYRRLDFECEVLLIANCEFLHVTTPLLRVCSLAIPNMHALSNHACSIYLHACTYSCWSWRISLLQFFKPIANLPIPPSQAQPSLEQYGILLIAHPTCSLINHTSIAKIEGVAFSFGHSQSLESQASLYSTIRNLRIQNPTYSSIQMLVINRNPRQKLLIHWLLIHNIMWVVT